MRKKTIGMLITALVLGGMIVMMVKSNTDMTRSDDNLAAGTIINDPEDSSGLKPGEKPPNFELTTLAGDAVKLSDYEGKKVILNFWASWCPPCKAEMPHMEKYYKHYKDSANVEILAVNMTMTERRGLEHVEQFVDAYKLTFPILLDESGDVSKVYDPLTSPPMTYMLNTDGTIAHVIHGPIDEDMMIEQVDALY